MPLANKLLAITSRLLEELLRAALDARLDTELLATELLAGWLLEAGVLLGRLATWLDELGVELTAGVLEDTIALEIFSLLDAGCSADDCVAEEAPTLVADEDSLL